MTKKNQKKVKCVLVGDTPADKTLMLISYTTGAYPQDFPTVFDNYGKDCVLDGKTVMLELWDTAGQADYTRLRPLSYPQTDVFLVCFSVMDHVSFSNVATKWVPELVQHAPGVPILLVGNHIDSRANAAPMQEGTQAGPLPVSTDDGEKLALELAGSGVRGYWECSCVTREGLEEVFEAAMRAAIPKSEHEAGRKCAVS